MGELTKYQDAVLAIKNTILQSRYQAARAANKEQLILYYAIGRYASENTRSGKWGTGAIEDISAQLQKELPGLRGFSATNMKYMRLFYENWQAEIDTNRQSLIDDLNDQNPKPLIHRLSTDELSIAKIPLNRHLASDDLESSNHEAFLRTGRQVGSQSRALVQRRIPT